MNCPAPHYLLTLEASHSEGLGRWRFLLRPVDGSREIEAADIEPDVWGERLDLLTVVRALESLDQPSSITLIGSSRYVEQGVLYGLTEWKENNWRWECFGHMVPIRDVDLWQRMDRILQIHRIDCRRRRLDAGHAEHPRPHWDLARQVKDRIVGLSQSGWVKCCVLALTVCCGLGVRIAAWMKSPGLEAPLAAASTRQ